MLVTPQTMRERSSRKPSSGRAGTREAHDTSAAYSGDFPAGYVCMATQFPNPKHSVFLFKIEIRGG